MHTVSRASHLLSPARPSRSPRLVQKAFRPKHSLPALISALLIAALLCVASTASGQVKSNGSGGDLFLDVIGMRGLAHTINTDTGEINGVVSPGWDGVHFHFVNIDIQDVMVGVVGSQPLILLASGQATIEGQLVARGESGFSVLAEGEVGASGGPRRVGGGTGGIGGGNTPFASNYYRAPGVQGDGAGGGLGGVGAASDDGTMDYGSGGSGGHANSGSPGGAEGLGTGGTGGPAITARFAGGSGGAGGSQEDDDSDPLYSEVDDGGAGGGGGGGAVRVVALGSQTLTESASINVAGGSGGNSSVSGAGGGGAGGRIELLAPTLPSVDGTLDITGGTGGEGPTPTTGGGAGSDGTTRVETYFPFACSQGGTDLALGAGTFTIDTDLGEIDGIASPGFDGFSFHFNTIDISVDATVQVLGSAPLVMLAVGDATVAGTITADGGNGGQGGGAREGGSRGSAGPGGYAGARGGGVTPGTGTGDGENGHGPGGGAGGLLPAISVGGGGAGHSVAGEAGGNTGGVPAPAGASYAIDLPLVGGSGGGGGTVHNSAPTGGGAGGGGGGAVRILSGGTLTVTGTIGVSGGDGGRGPGRAGGGGGGSGGVVDLQASFVLAIDTATLDISGGASGISGTGSSPGGAGADGRITTDLGVCQIPLFADGFESGDTGMWTPTP